MRPINPIGQPFIQIGEVDSSNNYAMQQVQAHLAEHGVTFFASYQTQGKGQRGKVWNAEPRQNIMISCVIEPALLNIDNQFVLSVAIALGCYDFFSLYALHNTFIKWPNDIYWKDRKAGGILIENIWQGKEWKFAIAGIGLNINQILFPQELQKAVSLKQITGKTFDIITMANQLCLFLERRCQMLGSEKNTVLLLKEYNKNFYKKNEKGWFKHETATFTALIKGVNEQGDLLLSDNAGIVSAFPYGTLEWIID